MSDKITVTASTEKLQPIFSNHVRMSAGSNGMIYFDYRTVVPDYSGYSKNPEELEGKEITIDFDEKIVPAHTRIAMPMDAAVSLRKALLRAIQIDDAGE